MRRKIEKRWCHPAAKAAVIFGRFARGIPLSPRETALKCTCMNVEKKASDAGMVAAIQIL